jgi:hypothetical protein
MTATTLADVLNEIESELTDCVREGVLAASEGRPEDSCPYGSTPCRAPSGRCRFA